MQHFNVFIQGAGALDGVYRDVQGSTPDIAVKRVLAGMGDRRAPGIRQVGETRASLAIGSKLTIEVKRWK